MNLNNRLGNILILDIHLVMLIEAVCGFGGLSHGESVMIGMAYSLILSEEHGEIDKQLTNEFIQFALANGYTFDPVHEYSFQTFMDYMAKDKKASFGKLNFALLQAVGNPLHKRNFRYTM